MTARDRVARARGALAAAALLSSLLWGAGAALVVYASLVGAALVGARWLGAGGSIGIAAAAGAAVAGAMAWRRRNAWSAAHVALWIEERVPALRYALVTAIERDERTTALEQRVAETEWQPVIRSASLRVIGVPALALVVALLLVVMLPALRGPLGAASRAPAGRLTTSGTPAEPAARLAPLQVTIQPPGYTGLAARSLDDPSGIPALAGSRVIVRGPGSADGIAARLGESALSPDAEGGAWRVRLTMPARPAALRLMAGSEERLIVLEPRLDSVPRVALLHPARDTIYRAASGAIALAAEARDDFGLADLAIEYIVSSGQGESFTFTRGTLGRRAAGGNRSIDLRAGTTLQALELHPGDIVHLRAVARDRNDVTGPGTGYSETRMLRIARPDEYDSLSIEPLPPLPGDTGLLSQRMLIQLTEELEARRRQLARQAVIEESRRIGADQARLRRQVGEIIFMRLGGEPSGEHSHEGESADEHATHAPPEGRLTPEQLLAAAEAATNRDMSEALDFHGDETPVVAVNRPLLEAYNAMWDAGRELDIGEPDDALPHMRAALAAIQRARTAERIYLRGRAPAVIVDLARVRLAGKREGVDPAPVRPPDDPVAASVRRTARFDAALDRLAADDPSGADTLALLRLDALEDAPALATAIGEAIDALRAGREATDALVRARRLLGGDIATRTTLPKWSGAW